MRTIPDGGTGASRYTSETFANHEITWDGEKVTMYHYHATHEFPYTVGCYRGTAINIRPGG